jgi:flagellar basal body-associated protein FliL
MNHSSKKERSTTSIAIIAIVAALALLGVVVVMVVTISQQAEARGCPTSTPGINASKGRCFRP